MKSYAEVLADMPERDRIEAMAKLSNEEAEDLLHRWEFWARPKQLAPQGDWTTWLVLAGRGWGKTRVGAEWVRQQVKAGAERIALVAPTAADARDVMVGGESGVLAVCWEGDRDHKGNHLGRPVYEPSRRRVVWGNGAVAMTFSAEEPDRLRGPQHSAAWTDELAAWSYAQETWDMLQFGLRLGVRPRTIVTTTPRPTTTVKEILADSRTFVTRGSMYENRSNLAATFISKIEARYAGTRLGRQEIDAEVLDDSPDALWQRSRIDEHRRPKGSALPDMQRVVVAIDPASSSGGSGETGAGAETGIVVAGIGTDGRGYVLCDATCAGNPDTWARRAVAVFDEFDADAIIAETNQGGEMIEAVIRSVRPRAPVLNVHASRGKVTRAEPVAALYTQGRVSHVGSFPQLEDQMVAFTPFGINPGDKGKTTTGDRVDALVWAMTNLFPSIIHFVEPKEKAAARKDGWSKAFAKERQGGSGWKTA